MYELEFTFEYQTIDAADVLGVLDKLCPVIGFLPEDYSTAAQVKEIESEGCFSLAGKLFTDINWGSIAHHNHDVLIIESESVELSKLIHFVELVIDELPVIQAFIHNHYYRYWQNAEDTLLYDVAGKDHSFLPKKSNGLPFPLEQIVVDISNNPGRCRLGEGYRESISSPMWLSQSLILDLELLQRIATVTKLKDGDILKISTLYNTFDKADGEQGELQRQLRNVIYCAR